MPNYHATVRLFDINGVDKISAQHAIEEKLQSADLGRWQIVEVLVDAPPLPVQRFPTSRRNQLSRWLGPLLILGAMAWAVWFYSLLMG